MHPARASRGTPPSPWRAADPSDTSLPDAAPDALELELELDEIIGARGVHSLFQPIVDLASGETVAYEALSRGPVDGALHRPDALFAAARRAGRVDELDHLCRVRALETVMESTLHAPYALFVNREPAAVADVPSGSELMVLRRRGLRAVVELTERDLSRDPARLLAVADQIRAAGLGIALDDVGVDADSLAFMPFLMPDVIKLDMGLLHRRADAAAARVLSAVRAHAERRGTLLLAEGIETPAHERMARGLGATLGQGWLYGRPGPLSAVPASTSAAPLPMPSRPLLLRDPDERSAPAAPFAMVTAGSRPLRGSVELLFALRLELEAQVEAMHGLAVVLLSCIDAPVVSQACAVHYRNLADAARFAVAVGAGMPEEMVPGLRGAVLEPDDPVAHEWDLVVVSPHFSAALVARERADAEPDEGRVFDYVLTYDRNVVVDVARTLLARTLPLAPGDPGIEAALTTEILDPADPG